MKEKFTPAAAFHGLTPLYDRMSEFLGYGLTFKRKVLELAQIQDGERVLDVGAGSGTFLVEAKKCYPHSEIIGIDPDKNILKIAQNKLKQAGIDAKLIEGYAQELPFPDATFDIVVSTLIFHHMPTPVKKQAIQEIHRVLKVKGRFLLVDFGKPDALVETVLLNIGSIFDGRENMRANLTGRVPKLLKDAGFEVGEIAPRYKGIQFLLARK